MGKSPSHTGGDPINRRTFSKRAAWTGGALAGLALPAPTAFAQREGHSGEAGSTPGAPGAKAAPPNLHPPVVQVKGGRLRGFRDGRTYTFLGIPYAEADRFELPKPVRPW
ncbi:MAG TPA: hypothetical protein VJ732_13355, partial [Bryobacteraceae bacterium]|nr:hypothetical protein [Bryobacteraceae bacterium]